MNSDAISTHECVVIIAHLDVRGKWSALRAGARVTMARGMGASGCGIQYAVALRPGVVVEGQSENVAAAVVACNQIIREGKQRRCAGRASREPDRRGAAPLVRRRA